MADRDADGLPDAFETTFGLSTNSDNRTTDADLDGLGDSWEYVAGTNPRDAQSGGPWLRSEGRPDSGRRFVFTAHRAEGPGYEGLTRFYTIEHRSDLQAGEWLPLAGFIDIPAVGQTVSIPMREEAAFFRARIGLR